MDADRGAEGGAPGVWPSQAGRLLHLQQLQRPQEPHEVSLAGGKRIDAE